MSLTIGACAGLDQSTTHTDEFEADGKLDGDPVTMTRLAECNGGDLILSKVTSPMPYGRGYYHPFVATVTDRGVVDWFEGQLVSDACGPSYYGGTACVSKVFPLGTEIKTINGERVLQIANLNDSDDGSYNSFPGTHVSPAEDGYDVGIVSSGMPNSHTNIVYTIGNWYFEQCVEEQPREPCIYVTRVNGNQIGCNDDTCGQGPEIKNVPISNSTLYFLYVDGFDPTYCGPYSLDTNLR